MKTPQRYTLINSENDIVHLLFDHEGHWIKYDDFVIALQQARQEEREIEQQAYNELTTVKVAQLKERLRQVRKTRGKSLRQFEVDDVIDEVFGK